MVEEDPAISNDIPSITHMHTYTHTHMHTYTHTHIYAGTGTVCISGLTRHPHCHSNSSPTQTASWHRYSSWQPPPLPKKSEDKAKFMLAVFINCWLLVSEYSITHRCSECCRGEVGGRGLVLERPETEEVLRCAWGTVSVELIAPDEYCLPWCYMMDIGKGLVSSHLPASFPGYYQLLLYTV